MTSQHLDYIAVLDFEATCNDKGPRPSPQEIIEFPTVLVDVQEFRIIDEFSTFVRPVYHPKLSPFCTSLTSIVQSDVAHAETFREVFEAHKAWIQSHGLSLDDPDKEGASWSFLTCGDWDFASMLPNQLAACDPPINELPIAYARWINIKKTFAAWSLKRKAGGMARMLQVLNIPLEGRHHRGIDDCRNIMKIARSLHNRGVEIEINAWLATSRFPPLRLSLISSNGDQHSLILRRRSLSHLYPLANKILHKHVGALYLKNRKAPICDADLLSLPQDSQLWVQL